MFLLETDVLSALSRRRRNEPTGVPVHNPFKF